MDPKRCIYLSVEVELLKEEKSNKYLFLEIYIFIYLSIVLFIYLSGVLLVCPTAWRDWPTEGAIDLLTMYLYILPGYLFYQSIYLSSVRVANQADEVELLKEEAEADLKNALNAIKLKDRGNRSFDSIWNRWLVYIWIKLRPFFWQKRQWSFV